MVSAGFGAHTSSISTVEDMRDSKEAFTKLGQQLNVPSLWLYAKGNKRIREQTARELFAVFQSGSATAKLEILPELGMDGDNLFSHAAAPLVWQSAVAQFLASLSLELK
jgi:hypothetical protein